MARTMVTTTDNPYNPFTQYDLWVSYDEAVAGYYTNSYIARIAVTSPELSEKEMDSAIESAVDEICEMDLRYISPVTGEEVAYVKVVEGEDIPKSKEKDE